MKYLNELLTWLSPLSCVLAVAVGHQTDSALVGPITQALDLAYNKRLAQALWNTLPAVSQERVTPPITRRVCVAGSSPWPRQPQ